MSKQKEAKLKIFSKILVVDDNISRMGWLTLQLEDKGCLIHTADSGNEALRKVGLIMPDLILLDLEMPGIGGLDVCNKLKEKAETRMIPIMIFTSHPSQENKLRSIEYKADFFYNKQEAAEFFDEDFYPTVLALLRRDKGERGKTSKNIIEAGDFMRVNIKENTVYFYDEAISDLPPKLFEILVIFVRKPTIVFSREDIEERVWKKREGRPVKDRTVDSFISRIKKRLGPKAEGLFQNVTNKGWRLLPSQN